MRDHPAVPARLLRKVRDELEVREFTPQTSVETLRDRMNRGQFTTIGWIAPPSHLSDEGWLEVGALIKDFERGTPWMWADWWLARGSRSLPDDWDGPDQGTLDNRASTARAFPVVSRRRENVSFKHHTELTGLSEVEQDELLAWCATPDPVTKRRPSVLALRAERQRRAALKLPPPESPRIAPKLKLLPPSPAVQPPPEPEIEPPLPSDVEIPVFGLRLPEDLHARATDTAAAEGLSLVAWIVTLIEEHADAA